LKMLERSASDAVGVAADVRPLLGAGPPPGARVDGREPRCRDCSPYGVSRTMRKWPVNGLQPRNAPAGRDLT
jgi:hypothetical protein